jgi:nitroreductase
LAAAVVRQTPAFLREAAGDEASLIWGGHLSAAMGLLAALLAAEALGLGGCCLGGPLMAKEALEGELGLKGREEISLMAAFGYPEAAGDPMAEEGD